MEQTKHTEKARQELREIAEGMDINKLLDIVVFGQKRNGVFEHVLVERVERLSDPSTKQMIAEGLKALKTENSDFPADFCISIGDKVKERMEGISMYSEAYVHLDALLAVCESDGGE